MSRKTYNQHYDNTAQKPKHRSYRIEGQSFGKFSMENIMQRPRTPARRTIKSGKSMQRTFWQPCGHTGIQQIHNGTPRHNEECHKNNYNQTFRSEHLFKSVSHHIENGLAVGYLDRSWTINYDSFFLHPLYRSHIGTTLHTKHRI